MAPPPSLNWTKRLNRFPNPDLKKNLSFVTFSLSQLKIQLKYHPSRYTCAFFFFCLPTRDDSAEIAASSAALFWVIHCILGGTRGLYISIKFKIPHVLQNRNGFKFSGNRPLTSLAAL